MTETTQFGEFNDSDDYMRSNLQEFVVADCFYRLDKL